MFKDKNNIKQLSLRIYLTVECTENNNNKTMSSMDQKDK